MTTPFKTQENFNDLIFQDRNKEYGAYALRNAQANTVTKSMFISLAGISLIVLALCMVGKGTEKIPNLDGNILPPITWDDGITIEIEKPKIKPDHQKDPTPPKSDNGNVVASDEKDKTIDKTNEQQNISSHPGDSGNDSSARVVIPELPKITTPPENNDPKTWVDIMPEFEGNLYQFIKDNLRYPQIAKENGTFGLVGLSFIIEKDGSIGEIKVLKDVPDGCTQEAIRVVRMMP
jgi:periplasmic protein TonB